VSFFYIYICSYSTKLCYLYPRFSWLTSAKLCVYEARVLCRIPNLTQTTLPQRSSHIDL